MGHNDHIDEMLAAMDTGVCGWCDHMINKDD